jgi:two-component system chemotaxis response regulator CheB
VKIIALVSSTGGLEATSSVLAGLPADFPASIVVLQHTSPDRESLLPKILQRQTRLSVASAEDETLLAAGHVHVAPAGCHTLVTPDQRISLIQSGAFPPARPSADLLLTTLAMAAGERVIAVVMTGRGHDAATGATAIHKHGGVVIATDEETSDHFSMPAATIARDKLVNAIVPVPELAPRLIELVTAPDVSLDRG